MKKSDGIEYGLWQRMSFCDDEECDFASYGCAPCDKVCPHCGGTSFSQKIARSVTPTKSGWFGTSWLHDQQTWEIKSDKKTTGQMEK